MANLHCTTTSDTNLSNSSITIEPNCMYQMRHKLVEMMEELKLLRKWHSEKEIRIEQMHNENFRLKKSLELENSKSLTNKEVFEKQFSDLRLEYEERIKKYHLDQLQVSMKIDSKDYIEKKLQDALSVAQLRNYHADKTIRELEDKVKSVESAIDKMTIHFTNFEKIQKKWQDTYWKTERTLERLEEKVKLAVKDNAKMDNLLRHHKCIVEAKTDEIENLREELLQVKVDSRLETTQEAVHSMDKTITHLNHRILNLEKQISELTDELAKRSSRTKEAVESMTQAHQLVLKHLANAEERRNEVTLLFSQCSELRAQNTQLSLELRRTERKLETETQMYNIAQHRWKDRESQLQETLTSFTDKLNFCEKEKKELEESNFISNRKIEELSEQISEIQLQLNVDKVNLSQQTETSCISLCDSMLQVSPDVTTQVTQTNQLVQLDRESQTYFRMPSVHVQTEYLSVTSSCSQTHLAAIMYDTDSGLQEIGMSPCSTYKEVPGMSPCSTYKEVPGISPCSTYKEVSGISPCSTYKEVVPGISPCSTYMEVSGTSSLQLNTGHVTIQNVQEVDINLTKTTPIPWSHVAQFSVSKTDPQSCVGDSNVVTPLLHFKRKSKSHLHSNRRNISLESLKNIDICKAFDIATNLQGPQNLSDDVTFQPFGQKRQKVLNNKIGCTGGHSSPSTGGHSSPISLLNLFIHSNPNKSDNTKNRNKNGNYKGIIKDKTGSKILKNVNKKSVKFPEQIETFCEGLTPQRHNNVILSAKKKLDRKIFLKSFLPETDKTSPTGTAQSPLLFTAPVLDDKDKKLCDDDMKDDNVPDSWSSDMTSNDIIHLK